MLPEINRITINPESLTFVKKRQAMPIQAVMPNKSGYKNDVWDWNIENIGNIE
jgi:hypothetical protein